MSDRKLICVFRRPRFPIICNIDGELVAASTLQQFGRRIGRLLLRSDGIFRIVDATGEAWVLYIGLSAISPLIIEKQWKKAQVVELFNTSLNAQRAGLQYPHRSISNRRLDVVIRDVVELLDLTGQLGPRARKGARA